MACTIRWFTQAFIVNFPHDMTVLLPKIRNNVPTVGEDLPILGKDDRMAIGADNGGLRVHPRSEFARSPQTDRGGLDVSAAGTTRCKEALPGNRQALKGPHACAAPVSHNVGPVTYGVATTVGVEPSEPSVPKLATEALDSEV
jgi:hypothetical protein